VNGSMKYKCKICGYIYDEEKENISFVNQDNFVCPMCFAGKALFALYNEEEKTLEQKERRVFQNAIIFSEDNLGVSKDNSKCIDCGICSDTCKRVCGLNFFCDTSKCLSCGQCIMTCPTGALKPKSEREKVLKAAEEGKTLICYTSPGVRVSIGEAFGMGSGTFLVGKLVASLRKLGFDYVLDTTFGADLTIMEEVSELRSRIKNNGILPMFTSCCPAWVKYAENYEPDILNHISSSKSPIGMQGEMVKNYFAKKMELDKENIFTVAITPCTAKKFEVKREEIPGTDAVLTISEVIRWLKDERVDFANLVDSEFDSIFGEGSGGGTLFGNSGGVMEAALRTFYYLETGTDMVDDTIFDSLRGLESVKELSLTINKMPVKVAVVNTLSAAKKIIEDVKRGVSPYHFIEIMNCKGGCIGGGGQPKYLPELELEKKNERMKGLYLRDKNVSIRASHHNPDIKRIYEEFLGSPNSEIAHRYLHTTYRAR